MPHPSSGKKCVGFSDYEYMAFFLKKRNKGDQTGITPLTPFLLTKERYTYRATRRPKYSTLKMEAARIFEMSAISPTSPRCNNPKQNKHQ
jgi:hypothetical protein